MISERKHITLQFKVVIVGPQNSGKSHFISRLKGEDQYNYIQTIGVDFSRYTQQLIYNNTLYTSNFILWDTGGSIQFQEINKAFYRGSTAVIIIIDINDWNVLQIIEYIQDIKQYIADTQQITLIANKTDLDQFYNIDDLISLIQEENIQFQMCSALQNKGVLDSISKLNEYIIRIWQQQ
ncbi:Rab1a [Hexamita inflata]|uniref:Rab1a n=1 Tax=Hexamita inflata TaxID=28002 RepID=A0ABP1IIC9_9EUKA